MIGRYFIHQSELKPVAEAFVSLDDINFTYGYGVYETLKVRNGLVFFPENHIDRLIHSSQIIGINADFDKQELKATIHKLVTANEIADCNLKILYIGGAPGQQNDLYLVCLNPLFPPKKLYKTGADVITYSGERHFPQAKSLSMLLSAVAYRQAVKNNCYDALLVDRQERITEGTRTNLFYIRNGQLYTTPAEAALEGVTRLTLIDCLSRHSLKVNYQYLQLSELSEIDGLFLTSTSSKVMPVRTVDGKSIATSDLTHQINTWYDEYLTEYIMTLNEK